MKRMKRKEAGLMKRRKNFTETEEKEGKNIGMNRARIMRKKTQDIIGDKEKKDLELKETGNGPESRKMSAKSR